MQQFWMKEDFYTGCVHVSGSLSAHFLHCSDMDLYHGHSEQLSHHLHALHRQWIQKHLSPVISSNKHWEIVRLKRKKKKKGPQKMLKYLKSVDRNRKEQTELYCLGTLKKCWRLMFSLSFHAGLSQINNLCNILSHSVHSHSLVATGI